jgi:large subunit ribosomal protein L6e
LLAGRFKGKRVVFLKQLESGLLLVTGPFKVNGVPLRRVNQAYVIATSTKIDVSGVDTSGISDVPDAKTKKHFFSRVTATEAKGDDEGVFVAAAESKKAGLSEERKTMQAKVDAAVLASVEKTAMMKDYLKSRFSLQKGQHPHLMKF